MRKLIEYINRSTVFFNIEAKTKEEAVHYMISEAVKKGASIIGDIEQISSIILKNEQTVSSGIGYGVAFPHAHVEGIEKTTLIFATSKSGIDFNSLDHKPAHLIVLFLTPPGSSNTYVNHLSTLAGISHLTMNVVLLMEAQTENEFKQKLIEFVEDVAKKNPVV